MQAHGPAGEQMSGTQTLRSDAAPPNSYARFTRPNEPLDLVPKRLGWQCDKCGTFDEPDA